MPVPGCSTGVYVLTNSSNGKVYVGSTVQPFRRRWNFHLQQLRKGVHRNRHLQHAYDKYGPGAFSFRVVERCNPEACLPREQFWIDKLSATDRSKGYNISPTAGNCSGVKYTPERLAAMRERLKDKEHVESMLHGLREYRKQNPDMSKKASAKAWSDPVAAAKMKAGLVKANRAAALRRLAGMESNSTLQRLKVTLANRRRKGEKRK